MKETRRIALFGSTGSIGVQTLDVLERLGGFDVAALTARSNWKLLAEQALHWEPEVVAIADDSCFEPLADALADSEIRIEAGERAAASIAAEVSFDVALNALVGVSGLKPSYEILRRGIDLALANKESLVLAGELLNSIKSASGARLIPVDSEHSAIFQCLIGEPDRSVRRLILTASGGPFREWTRERMEQATVEQALRHPTWKMGRKITIDSASLMNKGLEVIEAYHLFGVPPEKIAVRLHPQSIVHSFVQFADGSLKAQLGRPDMCLPIQLALTFPERIPTGILEEDDPAEWPDLTFERIEPGKFKCLELAYDALEIGGSAPAVLNGADEVAVERFLNGEIAFGDIPRVIAGALMAHSAAAVNSIEAALAADGEGRRFARGFRSGL